MEHLDHLWIRSFQKKFKYCRNDAEKAEVFMRSTIKDRMLFVGMCLKNRKFHLKHMGMIKKIRKKDIPRIFTEWIELCIQKNKAIHHTESNALIEERPTNLT